MQFFNWKVILDNATLALLMEMPWGCFLFFFFFPLTLESIRIFSEIIYWHFTLWASMTLGSNSYPMIFDIRFPPHSLENRVPFSFFHQLFFIFLFLEDRFSEAVISKCHFPGTVGFQGCFFLSVVTEVSPWAMLLRLSFSWWLIVCIYSLSVLFGL